MTVKAQETEPPEPAPEPDQEPEGPCPSDKPESEPDDATA